MLPADLVKTARRIEVRTRRLVDESFAGHYQSTFRGQGIEFSEVRPYQSGDDVRTIDWNVTARMGSPYVKRFVEERELTVMIAVDASGSGDIGTVDRLKHELAVELAAVISFAATTSNDRVGLALFNSANASSLMGAAAPRHRGQASATMSLARNTGQSVGQALWGTLWGVLAAGLLGVAVVGDQPLDTAFDAFRVTWAAAAVVTLLALVASLARGPGGPDDSTADAVT